MRFRWRSWRLALRLGLSSWVRLTPKRRTHGDELVMNKWMYLRMSGSTRGLLTRPHIRSFLSANFALTAFWEVRSKGVGLPRDHRFDWPRGGYGVCVTMHDLPGALFRSKDHRNPQIERRDIPPFAYPSFVPLYPHNVGKFRGHILLYDIEASDLATADLRCGRSIVSATCSHPCAGGPRGLARVTSSRWENISLLGSGLPLTNSRRAP
jgi:hypothetical protein